VKDTKVFIWFAGVLCGIGLFAVAVVGGAGVGALLGFEGLLVASLAAAGLVQSSRWLIARRASGRTS